MSYRLDVLVPSRGRPGSIGRLWAAIRATAAHPESVRLLVRLDEDDATAGDYPLTNVDGVWYFSGPRTKLAASWNELARRALTADATHLALWGDDNIPLTPGWDRTFVDRLDREGPGWVYGRDGVWDNRPHPRHPEHLILPTATVVSAELAEALGWVSPPGLVHLCIDLAWQHLGLTTGALYFERGVEIRHLHRMLGAPDDQTYRDANDDMAQKHGDHVNVQRWHNGPEFREACAVVAEQRRLWAALRLSD